jgi:ribonuclease J
VYVRENEAFLDDVRAAVRAALAERRDDEPWDRDAIVGRVRTAVRQLVNQRVQRKPMVLPIILEV